MSTTERALDIQRELAVLMVRHDETRRRLDALIRTMAEQDARMVDLRARIELQRANRVNEGRPRPAANTTPRRALESALRAEQEGDVVPGLDPTPTPEPRPSHIRQLRPDGSVLGPVSAGLLALLGNGRGEARER